jgi:hypothetical protein
VFLAAHPVTNFFTDGPSLCGTALTVYTVTDTLWVGGGGAYYYEKVLGTCTGRVIPPGKATYAGTPTSPYPIGTVAPDASNGRLGYLMWTGPDGVSIPVANWDHALGRECYALVASDGVFRCLPHALLHPQSLSIEQGYSTSSCDGSPYGEFAGACDGVPPVSNQVGSDGRDPAEQSCDLENGEGWDVSWSGAPFTAYYASETACVAYPETAFPARGLGSIIDPATFPALHEVIE